MKDCQKETKIAREIQMELRKDATTECPMVDLSWVM
jgi:hypothetical protein